MKSPSSLAGKRAVLRALVVSWSCSPPAVAAADPALELGQAFAAAYGRAAPVDMGSKEPIRSAGQPGRTVEFRRVTVHLSPERLIRLGGTRYALVIRGTVMEAGHGGPGTFSIAYLDRSLQGWTLRRLWPELIFVGRSGSPFEKTWEARFGDHPLLLSSSTYCGMGSCGEGITATALTEDEPRLLGTVPGGAQYTSPFADDACKAYHYLAKVGPPASTRAVLSVTYSGWSGSPDGQRARQTVRQSTDFVTSDGHLVAARPQSIPTCGQ